jgi:RNA polymerase sigma factor (sigma-70 family)
VLLDRFIRHRDEAAFAALVSRHASMVFGVCRRVLRDAHEAEDAFQAVWLVLAKRAATIRRPEALTPWLYGTAHRLALKCRQGEERRRQREARSIQASSSLAAPPDPLDELTARELLQVLDEELQGLPEVYRAPVILCCLEGRTQDEAAAQLGWSPGSLKGRLERGRKRLHACLVRRGLELSVALAAVAASHAVPPAAVSTVLTGFTVRAAVGFALGKPGEATVSSAVSAKVMALAESAIEGMAVAKLKVGLGLALAVGIVTAGAGALAHQVLGPKQPEARQDVGPTSVAKGSPCRRASAPTAGPWPSVATGASCCGT